METDLKLNRFRASQGEMSEKKGHLDTGAQFFFIAFDIFGYFLSNDNASPKFVTIPFIFILILYQRIDMYVKYDSNIIYF